MELSDLHVTQSDEHLVAQGDRSDAAPPGSDAAPPGNTHAGASIASGVLNMANTILGAGMLALPHAFAECGLSVGLIFLLIFASLSVLGLYLVSASADLAGRPSSFYAVAEKAVPGSGLIIDAAIAVKCFGVATSYLIIVGDSLPQALEPFGASGVLTDRRLWTLSAAVAVAPLAYLKEIDALRHTSLAARLAENAVHPLERQRAARLPGASEGSGLAYGARSAASAAWRLAVASGARLRVCPRWAVPPCRHQAALLSVLFVTVLVVLFALQAGPGFDPCAGRNYTADAPCRGAVPTAAPAPSALSALPVFVFAFTCHQNIISVTNELVRRRPAARTAETRRSRR